MQIETTVNIGVDMISDDELMDEVRHRGLLPTPPQAEDAWVEIMRGRKGEALILIERMLGSQWIGRLT